MIHFKCPTCQQQLQVQDEIAGSKVRCPTCSQKLLVPFPVNPASLNKTVLGKMESITSSTGTSPMSALPSNAAQSLSAGVVNESTKQNAPSLTLDWRSFLPWRYLSYSWLVAVVIFGFLPWCEVGCNGGNHGMAIRVTQSGYQALYGSYTSPLPSMVEDELHKEARKRVEDGMRRGESKAEKDKARKELQGQLGMAESYLSVVSPFLIVFWAVIVDLAVSTRLW